MIQAIIAALIWSVLMLGCSNIQLETPNVKFSQVRLFDSQQLENLSATGVDGMDITLGKHNSEADLDTLIKILESLR